MAKLQEKPCKNLNSMLYYLRFHRKQAEIGLSVSQKRVQRGCGCCEHFPRGRGLPPGAAGLNEHDREACARHAGAGCTLLRLLLQEMLRVGSAVGIALRSESAPGNRRMRVVPRKRRLSSQIKGRKGVLLFCNPF